MSDGSGLYGFILHYALLFALFGSALIVFIYLGIKGRLDMHEGPQHSLFEDEEE